MLSIETSKRKSLSPATTLLMSPSATPTQPRTTRKTTRRRALYLTKRKTMHSRRIQQQQRHRAHLNNSSNKTITTTTCHQTLSSHYHHHYSCQQHYLRQPQRYLSHHSVHTLSNLSNKHRANNELQAAEIRIRHANISNRSTKYITSACRCRRLKVIRASEYKNLRQVVPSLRRQRDVGKVEVVTEAARYIDHLHKTLIKRFMSHGIPDSLRDALGTDDANQLNSQHIMNLVTRMATEQRQQQQVQLQRQQVSSVNSSSIELNRPVSRLCLVTPQRNRSITASSSPRLPVQVSATGSDSDGGDSR